MISQLSNPWWIFILLGVCAGVLSGLLGLGSGIILIPTLVLLCECKQKSAQGMALVVMIPMVMLGALRYRMNPKIEMDGAIIGLIILGALAGVLVGTELMSRLPVDILRKVFAVVLIIVAVNMFVKPSKPGQNDFDDNLTNQKMESSTQNGDVNNDTTK